MIVKLLSGELPRSPVLTVILCVILFVLAFVPQFVDPTRTVLPQFLICGAVLSLGGFIINGLVGLFAGGIGRKLTGDARFATWLGRISAGIFVALAARLALMQRG
jgi:threonine/homoserine/homoserine lactone efflux protein